MTAQVRRMLRRFGFDVVRYPPPVSHGVRPPLADPLPLDVSLADREILHRFAGTTMTKTGSQLALIQAVRHLTARNIAGCFVECGVWRGGSSMAAALALLQEGDTARDLFLYDTFDGMPPPRSIDVNIHGEAARSLLDRDPERRSHTWAVAGLAEVRRNLESTGYPPHRIHYVQGLVEATLPAQAPGGPIALLRLDTDWYESTMHELTHLFPLVARHGIVIIDDYGFWQGATQATDEYFSRQDVPVFMHRIHRGGRLIVKT